MSDFRIGDEVVRFNGAHYVISRIAASGFLAFKGFEDGGLFNPKDYKLVSRRVEVDDVVNHPSHYKFENGVEVIDLTEQLTFNCGNAVKYLSRAGRKDSDKTIEDLQKAEFYVKREIARLSHN